MNRPPAKIAIFLALTLALSAIGWALTFSAGEGSPNALLYVILTMCCPGIAAIVTRLVTQGNVRGMGWLPGSPKFLALGYALPIAYALPVYAIAWAAGLGTFDPAQWVVGKSVSPAVELGLQATVGVVVGLIGATGEEIGWRGLLVPELAKVTSFRMTSLISGLTWASWHMPLIVAATYHGQGTPLLYSITCFVLSAVAISFVMAWLRLSSGSFWPAALMHASHNVVIQSVLDKATLATPLTNWWTGEFGAGLVISIWLAVWLLCRRPAPPRSMKRLRQLRGMSATSGKRTVRSNSLALFSKEHEEARPPRPDGERLDLRLKR